MKRCSSCGHEFDSAEWTCPDCGHVPSKIDGFICFAPGLSDSVDSYDADRYRSVAAIERKHFWFRGRNELIRWALDKFFPKAASLLEVGCGTGQVLESIAAGSPRLHLAGTEMLVRGLEFCRTRLPQAEFMQMDARAIPYVAEFDVVCAFDVIEHIEEDEKVLEQMYRACRPGGGLLITVPQHRWLWSFKDDFAHHRRRYSRKELLRKVEAAGFRVNCTTSFVSLLLPLMYLSRLLERAPARFDPQRELEISPLLNGIFGFLMRLELAAIRVGVRLPAGGSLLLAARKV